MVEVRQGTLWIAGRSWTRRTRRGRGGAGEAEGRRRGRTQATDIKSNNPHLAGGEIYIHIHIHCILYVYVCIVLLVSPNGNERIKLVIHHDQFCLCSPPQRSQHPKQARCKGLEATWPAWITTSLLVSTKLAVSTPLKNRKVSWGYYSQYVWKNKKCSKPPTRYSWLACYLLSFLDNYLVC